MKHEADAAPLQARLFYGGDPFVTVQIGGIEDRRILVPQPPFPVRVGVDCEADKGIELGVKPVELALGRNDGCRAFQKFSEFYG